MVFRIWLIFVLCMCGVNLGCGSAGLGRNRVLRMAVTTSMRDSGLLDQLIPVFERKQEVRVDVIAVGTGQALKYGAVGDVELVLVHARKDEDAFMAAGHGIRREDVMYNTFEIFGPPHDPAQIRGMRPSEALSFIAKSLSRFVSRGDDSGTHKKELELWEKIGGRPEWNAYVESGQGMGPTLVMANQMEAYVLADRGTYLKFKDTIELESLVQSREELANPYGILVVHPSKDAAVEHELAHAFVDFIISDQAQKMIGSYTVDGEQFFYPLH